MKIAVLSWMMYLYNNVKPSNKNQMLGTLGDFFEFVVEYIVDCSSLGTQVPKKKSQITH